MARPRRAGGGYLFAERKEGGRKEGEEKKKEGERGGERKRERGEGKKERQGYRGQRGNTKLILMAVPLSLPAGGTARGPPSKY